MRAGPLSSTAIVDRLNAEFVSSWVLFRDLPRLAQEADSEAARALAKTCLDHGIQPVDVLALSPAGELLGGLWVDDMLPYGGERPTFVERAAPPYTGDPTERYRQFLSDVLEKMRK